MIALLLIMINKSSRKGATILLVGYLTYSILALGVSGIYYYSSSAMLSFGAGLALHKINKPAALMGYALVFANLAGFFMWYLYMSPVVYNNVSMVLLVAQVIFLLPKGVTNGCRNNIQSAMASIARTDNGEQGNRANKIISSKAK